MTSTAMEDTVTIHDKMDLDTQQVVRVGTLCDSLIKMERKEQIDVRKKEGRI
jgi:hypothetical protein